MNAATAASANRGKVQKLLTLWAHRSLLPDKVGCGHTASLTPQALRLGDSCMCLPSSAQQQDGVGPDSDRGPRELTLKGALDSAPPAW